MTNRRNPRRFVDRISALPDSILSHILSFLPTDNAVATSILSKRWNFLWTGVVNLDFCLANYTKEKVEDMKFVEFVNHVLLHLHGGFLNKFSLVWRPWFIPSLAIPWISTAITRNVNELFLFLENFDGPFEIPSSVFSCGTLKSIEITGNMLVSDEIVVCLPRLESLKLVFVYFQSDEAFKKLISGCTVLNHLYISMDLDKMIRYFQTYRNNGVNVFTYIISSTSLRYFKLYVDSELFAFDDDLPHCSLELEAPSLEHLYLDGPISRIFVRETLSSLDGANFSIKMPIDEFSVASICNSLVEAVRALDCAKALALSRNTLWALSCATICLSTKFNRLTELEAETDCCYCSSLHDFIQCSDSLEELTIDKVALSVDEEDHTHTNWTTPVEVPKCLSNNLKTVITSGYSGLEYEREMIGYLLKHGSVLEIMAISCEIERDDVKFEMVREICEFPRKSPACTVKFLT